MRLLLFLPLVTGCWGWSSLQTGYAHNLDGRVDRGGPLVAVDSVFTLKERSSVYRGAKPFPIGLHNGVIGFAGKDLKNLSWVTGVAWMSKPRPISGYAIAGTNGHIDIVEGRFGFGNFQPYGELGLVTPFLLRKAGEERGPIVTFSAMYTYLVHYLEFSRESAPRADPTLFFKFGFGYEIQ